MFHGNLKELLVDDGGYYNPLIRPAICSGSHVAFWEKKNVGSLDYNDMFHPMRNYPGETTLFLRWPWQPLLGGSSQDSDTWLITMVIGFVP